ncbi:MAG: DUF4377 domain-containing protein [Bacteroides pyogenes]|uniref:DUF4377 domain-containing protein n=1 Tax=Bacteroides pyogenes TaxID=310300 RepID=UPI00242E6409|nr:DUF4377 domain-containing protein [Bacteroides pyogenes]MCI7071430.1 DUF4377 domain-containing protein [Bacteroides pyogenes]MDY5353759.1 DUF4377 domain-containing protein [Bacteroides pyogenes]
MNKLIIPFLLIIAFLSVGCSDDETKDAVKEIKMSVSSETGTRWVFGSEQPIECMLVMSEDNPGVWAPLDFNSIKGFTYERGHEYYLSVERTILANPPMDASDRTYSLLKILSDRLVTEPEVPVDKEINSEEDIEYYDMCPFKKYSIYKNFIVSENGEISYADGSSTPSYAHARIWLEDILDKADPNWIKFQSVSYMAIYSFVLSPLTKEIRLVRNESSSPMFKNVIPEKEFTHITQSMKSGEELRYALILANVHKMGLQKLEFTVKKQ